MGNRLFTRNPSTDTISASSDGPMSSPSARLAMRFSAADFMALNDPVKVVDASSAATPVKPKSV